MQDQDWPRKSVICVVVGADLLAAVNQTERASFGPSDSVTKSGTGEKHEMSILYFDSCLSDEGGTAV